MRLRVAITRAQPYAAQTAARVAALGAEPVLAPLLELSGIAFDDTIDDAQALVFTSANGVDAFAQHSVHRTISALCVGEATAAAAQLAGFSDVQSADGDVNALIELARRTMNPAHGRLVHISGAQVAGDLVGALIQAGFAAERRVAYRAAQVDKIPDAFSTQLDVVLFHSARAGQAFANLGAPGASQLTAACLSAQVAKAVAWRPGEGIFWRNIIVSPRPREVDLLRSAIAPTSANA